RATLGMYPDGEAARSNKPPFIDLDDLPAFETICEAAGGYGERVEDPKELPAAMKRALKAIDGGQQALLNVISAGGAGGEASHVTKPAGGGAAGRFVSSNRLAPAAENR